MMVGAYLRVSSRSQDVKTQQDAILRASKARGSKVQLWYSEKLGGAVRDRPELERALDDARGGKLTKLYVYRLDRLSRRGIRDTFKVLDTLKHYGCAVETIADGFTLDGPGGEVVVAVMAWAAQMERSAIGERIAAARVRVEASGQKWGRPVRASDTKVKQVKRLRSQGRTVRAIARDLKIPKSTVADILSEKGVYKPTLAKGTKKRTPALAVVRTN